LILASTPTLVAQQDVTSLLLANLEPSLRWAAKLQPGPGGETTLVSPRLGEAGTSAVITTADGSVVVEGVDPIVTGAINGADGTPDEERVDRSWKADLPMSVTTPATERGFSAGSVHQEQSRLTPPASLPTATFEAAEAPLSVLAVARFISPKPPTTEIASLQPTVLPPPNPHRSALVAANYPNRGYRPSTTDQAASALMAAYAPDSSVVSQDMFAALFTVPADKPKPPAPVLRPGDHWWAVNPLPASAYSAKEQRCLAEAVYFEARGEPYNGQVGVAQVVLNRVKNPAYPASICDVVYQNQSAYNQCQFSFACDGIKDVVHEGFAWRRAKSVAHDITYGLVWLDSVGTSTHYHATYVRPNWASVFTKKAKIGRHVFYQTIYGGWS